MSYQLVDSTPFPRQLLYDFLNAYFDSPDMQKMRNDENSGVSVYMTRIKSLLASPEQRFLVAIAPLDQTPVGTLVPMSELKWQSLQARMLNVSDATLHNVHRHSYQPKNSKKFSVKMDLIKRFPNRTEYSLDGFGAVCTVALMHTNPEQPFEFRDQAICNGSIELFRTVFFIKE